MLGDEPQLLLGDEQAYLRYSNAKEEISADQARRSASSTGRWGGDSYGDPPSPSKGVDSIERAKMVRMPRQIAFALSPRSWRVCWDIAELVGLFTILYKLIK